MNGRRPHARRTDQHANTDRWLLTYADLITLLLGLFVILYAISKVDNEQYMRVAQAFGGLFGGSIGIVPSLRSATDMSPDRLTIESKIRGAMYEDIRSQTITLSQDERGVVIHIAEEVLFASGSALLKSSSRTTLDLLASVLKTVPNEIRIEGHTDDMPIQTSAFPSNWHLSVARAVSTGEYLTQRHGFSVDKVSIIGYADRKPLVPNTSAENRAKNRRVDIIVIAPKANAFTDQ
ncbi:MAG: hypothetical protein C4326_00680 [Ignavibacteria bacterium]